MHRHSEMINHNKLLHKIDHSEPDLIHNFTVVIQQNNLDLLDEMLIARSTPGHELYQTWMTKDEIDVYTRNDDAVEAVTTWLLEHDVKIDAFSANEEYIYASAPIRQLEKMLDTKFYKWNATYLPDNVHRSEAYSLPVDIKPHVAGKLIRSHNALLVSFFMFASFVGMFNICDRPPHIKKHGGAAVDDELREASDVHRKLAAVNVPFLSNFYGIPTNIG